MAGLRPGRAGRPRSRDPGRKPCPCPGETRSPASGTGSVEGGAAGVESSSPSSVKGGAATAGTGAASSSTGTSAPIERIIGARVRSRAHDSVSPIASAGTRSHLLSTRRSAAASWRATVSRSRWSPYRSRTVSTSASTTTRSRESPGCRVATSATGRGSATPLASTRMCSGGRSPSSSRSSVTTRSSPIEQHTHPFANVTVSPSWAATRPPSTASSPKSLTSTA